MTTTTEELAGGLKAIAGALNARHDSDVEMLIRLTKLETKVEDIEKTLGTVQRVLLGLATGLIGLILQSLVKGVLK